jgi:hypothetical protein
LAPGRDGNCGCAEAFLLAGTFVVRVLPPWHENLTKRQVKLPKVYIADSGLLHSLLGVTSHGELERHPKIGASWMAKDIRAVAMTRILSDIQAL